ncbi:MAG: hypothetical protein LC769_01925 [Chloroflexi bacterium]|nr:hypothetical protein [Chloroflexota bacterium]
MLHSVERLTCNLSTIPRTSKAVGGAGLRVLGDTIDPYDPAVVRAT